MIAKGDVFGPNQKLVLHLLDIPPMMEVLNGVVMELADCALPLLAGVVPTADPAVAFKDVSAAFLVGAMPRECLRITIFSLIDTLFGFQVNKAWNARISCQPMSKSSKSKVRQ